MRGLFRRTNHFSKQIYNSLTVIRKHFELFSQKLSAPMQGARNNPVSQTGFASGDVELF